MGFVYASLSLWASLVVVDEGCLVVSGSIHVTIRWRGSVKTMRDDGRIRKRVVAM